MVDWLIQKWDWMIYRLAWHSLRRICRRDPGFAYLIELWIRAWLDENPMPDRLKSAAEKFFETMRDQRRQGENP